MGRGLFNNEVHAAWSVYTTVMMSKDIIMGGMSDETKCFQFGYTVVALVDV